MLSSSGADRLGAGGRVQLTLGLYSFDILHTLGDFDGQRRYCTQAVLPFLAAIGSDLRYRVTVSVEGAALEFLAREFPEALADLRRLIATGQIELASALYAPAFWPAFPRRDLLRSIELNRDCLGRLELTASRVFVGPGGLFGPGLAAFEEFFDVAVTSDDYLRYFGAGGQPAYRLGNLLVLVGGNSLARDLATAWAGAAERGAPASIGAFHHARLERAIETGSHPRDDVVAGCLGGVAWRWHHLGGAHELTCSAPPREWDSFFHDPDWMQLGLGVWDRLLADGYRMATASELAAAVRAHCVSPLPLLPEGAWRPKRNAGVYGWMGKRQRWQPAIAAAVVAWQSRRALVGLERELGPDTAAEKLDAMWREQLIAESASALGTAALPAEVGFARHAAENVFAACARLAPRRPLARTAPASAQALADPPVQAELLGAEGAIRWLAARADLYCCEIRFRPEEAASGVRFSRAASAALYCPSGTEESPVLLALDHLRPAAIYLPLANGLLGLGGGLFLIRDNARAPVAAGISGVDPWVSFLIEGAPQGRWMEWRFYIARCGAEEAVRLAGEINDC